MNSLTKRQLQLLDKMSQLNPMPFIIGGYAEDALVSGMVSRPHADIDWILPRRELKLRLSQIKQLGFNEPEIWGEAEPGKPFYLYAEHSEDKELIIDIAVYDETNNSAYLQMGKLNFLIDNKEPPVGYRLFFPEDMIEQPPVKLEGILVRPISPLALYQMRVGIVGQGSFGKLNAKQKKSLKRLKDTFFSNESHESLMPRIEILKKNT